MRRLWCWIWGHSDLVDVWEAWRWNPEVGRYRVCASSCSRCGDVFSIRSEVESEPWS